MTSLLHEDSSGAATQHVRSVLRRWDPGSWADWLVPALVAALWGLLLARAADPDRPGLLRSLVFVGGPALLMAGLHGRLTGYLHARGRSVLLPLPLSSTEHYLAARRRHVRGLLATVAVGTAAVALPCLARLGPTPLTWGLLVDWLAVAVLSFGLEPLIAGTSSWAGRRFAAEHPLHRVQVSLGGGWTLPEAVVHLYAPAFGVATAAALAMPLQIGVDLTIDGDPVPNALWGFAAAGLVLAVAAHAAAPRLYARGFFQAAPFVAEATRTLAGPPEPPALPRSIAAIRDPALRLLVTQYWRLTPVPGLRLGLLVAAAAWAALTGVDLAKISVVLVVSLLWLVPATTVRNHRPLRDRLWAALPVGPQQRSRSGAKAVAVLTLPVALALVGVSLAWSG
jgi:hypothetical protein